MTIQSELADARRWLKGITELHASTWGLGDEESWSFDQGSGKLKWSFTGGKNASADTQIVGTFVAGANQWLWAWENDSIDKRHTQCATAARRIGKKHDLDILINPSSLCTLRRAWDLAAFAAKSCNLQGVYRGKAGKTSVFFAFGDVTVESKPVSKVGRVGRRKGDVLERH